MIETDKLKAAAPAERLISAAPADRQEDAIERALRPKRLAAAPGAAPDAKSDILNALLALGYNEREALSAMKGLAEDVGVSDGIRQALQALSKP